MRTTKEWWRHTKSSPDRLLAWLFDQYRGEATAAGRIELLRDSYGARGPARRLLTLIAAQERRHAEWVGELLLARGEQPLVQWASERYWEKPLAAIEDLATGCAVGAHAEKMRLERIEEIAADDDAPADVRAVFQRILKQERFHERAFRLLAGPDAMNKTQRSHDLGRSALGLTP